MAHTHGQEKLYTGFSCDDYWQKEPPLTEYEIFLLPSSRTWIPPATEKFHVAAFGNYDVDGHQADIPLLSLIAAYALLYEQGPFISLEKFIQGAEAGNVGNLQCFACFKSGAFAHTPQERFMALRLCETLFGVIGEEKENQFRKCFTGDGLVIMGDGTRKMVSEVQRGDYVRTESGVKPVSLIECRTVNSVIPMCEVLGVWLTPGHPVFINGMWSHPFEVTAVQERHVTELFNFELVGGPLSPDHSVWINGLLVCTLGKDCGDRITRGWPKADDQAGTGYWRKASSNWSKYISHTNSPSGESN